MVGHLLFFSVESFLGIVFFLALKWDTQGEWIEAVRILFLVLLTMFVLGIAVFLSFNFIVSKEVARESALLFLGVILWTIGLGYVWQWKPAERDLRYLQRGLLLGFLVLEGIYIRFPAEAALSYSDVIREVGLEQSSPLGNTVATAVDECDCTLVGGERVYINLRPAKDPFEPANYFGDDFIGDNSDNVLVLEGYGAHPSAISLKWKDETHLNVFICYDQVFNDQRPGPVDPKEVRYSKKTNFWKGVIITYED